MAKKVKRLFEQFQPANYQLDLIPDREKMSFSGTVVIRGKKVGPPSQRITFHQKGLTITKAKLTRHDRTADKEIKVSRLNTHEKMDELRLHTSQKIFAGNYSVEISFRGKITRPMDGIYPCYFKHAGKEKKLIATQFESHFARQVFPCIDEPEAKATFDLSLTTPIGEAVVSNTPVKSTKASGKQTVTTFETTPLMPTYLLAFVYGELKFKEAKTKRGVVVRTYSTPGIVEHTGFALETAVRCLEFYEDYFDYEFPLPKCDLVALPDFAVAGMENWGCITFSEMALSVDDKNTSLANKQLVGMVVAHEMAHMWFGNLVTMRWWTDLWLNEGFASWVEHLALANLFPGWEMWTQFIVDEQQQAMRFDALEHTRAIEVPAINYPDEIRTAFDPPISYGKGSSAIHMLYHYLGEEAFKAGLRYYISQHAYKNTVTDDLWRALETASEKPVRDFMHSWIAQAGFPIVHATVEEDRLKLVQERFFINPNHSKINPQTWPIPLLAKNKQLPELFSNKSQGLKLPDTHELKLNNGQSGFYRVAYNSTQLERFGELIRKGHLEVVDRLGLLTDVIDCAKSGHTDTLDALHFLDNFIDESSYPVWEVISGFLGSLRIAMDDEQLREDMKPFIRHLVSKQLKRLGWQRRVGETHFDQLLRPVILGLAASADEPAVVARCQKIFKAIRHQEDISADLRTIPSKTSVKRGGDVDPDLRGLVFSTAARLGSEAEHKKLLRLYHEAKLSEEKVTIAAALTSFRQPQLIKRTLAMIKSKEVRLQDVAYWVSYSFLNRHARPQTWKWLTTNWAWLKENLGGDLSFYYMPIYSARVFSDKKFLPEYKKFFKSVNDPGLDKMFKRGVEMIQWQSAWKERASAEVKTFFKAQSENL